MTRAALLGMAVLLGACRSPDVEPGAAPRLELPAKKHDFGGVVQGQELRHAFTVRNGGAAPLELEARGSGRDCTSNLPSTLVTPGASGVVEVVCRPELFGVFRDSVTLSSNDPRAASTELELGADVQPLLAFERDQVDFDLKFGEQRTEELSLVGARAADARLAVADAGPCALDHEVLPAAAGEPERLRLRLSGKHAGVQVGQIVLRTGLDRPSELSLRYTCKVAGTLTVTPTNPFMSLTAPEPGVTVLVQSSAPAFRVRSVSIAEGPFRASLAPGGAPGRYRVDVKLVEARVTEDARGLRGTLVILSNDPTEPRKELPLMALGQLRDRVLH